MEAAEFPNSPAITSVGGMSSTSSSSSSSSSSSCVCPASASLISRDEASVDRKFTLVKQTKNQR